MNQVTAKAQKVREEIKCPICGKVLGAWLVEGSAVFIKDPCPRCKNRVEVHKKLDKQPIYRVRNIADYNI